MILSKLTYMSVNNIVNKRNFEIRYALAVYMAIQFAGQLNNYIHIRNVMENNLLLIYLKKNIMSIK